MGRLTNARPGATFRLRSVFLSSKSMNQHNDSDWSSRTSSNQPHFEFSANCFPHPLLPVSAILSASFQSQMNLHSFICGACCRRLVLVVVLASLVYQAVADDAKYEACAPQSCGYVRNISYPFWISGEQESYCGHPDFEITCLGIYPVMNFLDCEFFYIKEIFYANHSIRLVDALVYDDTCGAPSRNSSFQGTPFNLSSTNADFFFYYNCTLQNLHIQ
ncbi:LEAF RUST 10 DISEASE-RESISTANCE LOCUS RECEPTOR-LIKE PROTEIN KINASE-like 1.2 [Eucalyptus grandis]|uniref:LEAF RUST 10 DISEASE-RESISTANCE LOCUS RECEPTOR-LIKE PROTEIN KINASE-like 1.2 n=1 Tax=Eucalyptus grandis TaxID=71139 RepID=UPI00192EBDAD|nr:LEAF RUST 10 DISEASE-RESISTANCE LOCUS RECEPTOR-LIKE PROTEIN KINASE-like 1.2 [Eucalyptus grandis]